MSDPLHLALALDGAGYHPAAWRDGTASPAALFEGSYWVELARTAERGFVDFVTIEDSFGLQSSRWDEPDDRVNQVRGRLEALAIASFVAPATTHVGLVPTVVPTHAEPFHIASGISTLDWVSRGRGGWRPQVSSRAVEARHVGRRELPRFRPGDHSDPAIAAVVNDLFDEAADAVEVVRRLWDSWEDDAEIRDVATGRFIDREKLHYVDFEGRFFSIKGPSIVPRPPQGQPLVVALAHSRVPFEFAARSADVVLVTPAGGDDVARWVSAVRTAEHHVDRSEPPLGVFGDLVVVLAGTEGEARRRLERLDRLDGRPFRSDAAIFTGTPEVLAEELQAWSVHGLGGFRLRPAVIRHDLDAIVEGLVPALQRAGAFRNAYPPGLLRERLGLARPPSRYATTSA